MSNFPVNPGGAPVTGDEDNQPENSEAFLPPHPNYLICDRTGFRVSRHEGLRKEWNGAMVRAESWERRHPQDFVRSRQEHQRGSPRPEQADTFIDITLNPAPTLSSLQASDIGGTPTVAEGEAVEITLQGTDFIPLSVARITGGSIIALDTTYVSSTTLTAIIPANELNFEGTLNISVANPSPGGGTSDSLPLTVAAPDPFFDSVVLLVGADGADGSTSFTDYSNSSHTISAVGGAQIDTAQKKFGQGSILMDGSGDYLTIPDSDDWTFGEAFTIELWLRFNGTPGNVTLMNHGGAISGGDFSWQIRYASAGALLRFMLDTGGNGGWDAFLDFSLGGAFQADTWHHLALVRSAGVLKVFVDGEEKDSPGETLNTSLFNSTSIFRIGAGTDGLGLDTDRFFDGWMDEIRITDGVARYTSNFTPPAAAFPRL